jgi:hypothetical protein
MTCTFANVIRHAFPRTSPPTKMLFLVFEVPPSKQGDMWGVEQTRRAQGWGWTPLLASSQEWESCLERNLPMAAGMMIPAVMLCMPSRTKCIPYISVRDAALGVFRPIVELLKAASGRDTELEARDASRGGASATAAAREPEPAAALKASGLSRAVLQLGQLYGTKCRCRGLCSACHHAASPPLWLCGQAAQV